MPFTNSNSIDADAANNMLRGLNRDNTDNSHTGDTNETDLASFSLTGDTMGATGNLEIFVAGTITGTAGTKRLKLKIGSSTIYDSTAQAGANDWFLVVRVSNTATNAQRILTIGSAHNAAGVLNVVDNTTSSVDTTASQTIKMTGQLSDGADTITQTMFEIKIQQIT